MSDGLGDFLEGSEQPAVEAAVETPAPEAVVEAPPEKAERARGPDGKFVPKGETEAAPPAVEEQHSIPPKALQEERRKRQELEVQLAELRAQVQQPQQPAPSIWEDEQGWQQHFGSEVVGTAVQQATLNARLDMSEMMVRQAHPDFEDKKATFLDLMRQTPGLQEKALAEPHPWQFAYSYVTNHQRMHELSATNVTELEAKLRAEIEAKLRAEIQPQQPAPTIPETLADAQSARGSTASAVSIPSLDDILKR
jgi:hypothetical protein